MSDNIETVTIAPEPPKKRGPGRPRKEAAQKPIEATVSPEPKAAPRRKGATPEEVKAKAAKDLFGAHQFAALMTGLPELVISEQEAAMLADPMIDTLALLGLPSDLGKYMAPVSLVIAVGFVYGPRVNAIRARAAQAQRQRQQPPAANGDARPAPAMHDVGGVMVAMPSELSPMPD